LAVFLRKITVAVHPDAIRSGSDFCEGEGTVFARGYSSRTATTALLILTIRILSLLGLSRLGRLAPLLSIAGLTAISLSSPAVITLVVLSALIAAGHERDRSFPQRLTGSVRHNARYFRTVGLGCRSRRSGGAWSRRLLRTPNDSTEGKKADKKEFWMTHIFGYEVE
jgi:hypothetical protein